MIAINSCRTHTHIMRKTFRSSQLRVSQGIQKEVFIVVQYHKGEKRDF